MGYLSGGAKELSELSVLVVDGHGYLSQSLRYATLNMDLPMAHLLARGRQAREKC